MTQTNIREGAPENTTWWDQYTLSLRGEFSEQAIDEIERSTNQILSTSNIPPFDSEVWEESEGLRIGAAVGSIQSGKTANMIGLAAKGMDQGFRIVVATRSPYLHGYLKPLGNPGEVDLEEVLKMLGEDDDDDDEGGEELSLIHI